MILWSLTYCGALFGVSLSRAHTSESVIFTKIYMQIKSTCVQHSLNIHLKTEQLTNASIQVQCHTDHKQNNLSSILMLHIRLVCAFSTQRITKVVCRKQDGLRIVPMTRETPG